MVRIRMIFSGSKIGAQDARTLQFIVVHVIARAHLQVLLLYTVIFKIVWRGFVTVVSALMKAVQCSRNIGFKENTRCLQLWLLGKLNFVQKYRK